MAGTGTTDERSTENEPLARDIGSNAITTATGHRSIRYAVLAVVMLLVAAPAVSGAGALVGPSSATNASVATQSSPTVAVGNVTVASGTNGTTNLSLSSAPDGLSGFTVVVSVGSTSTATITNASAADSFGLTNVTVADNGSSVRIKAVDLDNSTTAGATDIALGRIEVTGEAGGQTSLSVSVERLDDDAGNPISATTDGGTVSVQAANFSITEFAVSPTSGTAPLNVTATATVTNTGDATDSTTVPFVVDGVVVDERLVSLAPGEGITISFNETLDAGSHTVRIGDSDAVTVDVSSSDGGGGGDTTTTTTSADGGTTTTTTTDGGTTTTDGGTTTTSTDNGSTTTTDVAPITTVDTTTSTQTPGFGVFVAALALVIAGLIAIRPE
ncbi:hypothetical protein [Halobaculum sp. EA56]|uniref:hypothetical protein n=1 Tax=Halobaculum sp. EA56 TaxID=3421648 RepID=UPI003EB8D26C